MLQAVLGSGATAFLKAFGKFFDKIILKLLLTLFILYYILGSTVFIVGLQYMDIGL